MGLFLPWKDKYSDLFLSAKETMAFSSWLFIARVLSLYWQGYGNGLAKLKKFESRLNAGEYACASVYLYDGDLPSFSFFVMS